MKLREAANILGVSLDDLTVDGLKLTYRKLLLAWDPEKVITLPKTFHFSDQY